MDSSFVFTVILFVNFVFSLANADPVEDKQALLEFVSNFPHARSLNWKENTAACNHWIGVICNDDKSRIVALHLPGLGFHGRIPANTISRLSALQILSLRSNAITGPFPSDFANLKNLSYLYLQFNRFTGPLPADFSVWKNMTIINLSNNAFNGTIPSSIANLTHLTALNLANNSLTGEIPDLPIPSLQQLNLANNSLSGSVPVSLRRFPSSTFSGNNISYVNPPSPGNHPLLPPVASHPPVQTRERHSRKLGVSTLLAIVVGASVVGFVAVAAVLVVCCAKGKREIVLSRKIQKGEASPEKGGIAGSQDGNNRLTFFEGCVYAFDLEDLLRASAEVLGKGTFGVAYKAVLEDATAVVVKRLKEVGVGKREFEQQMEVVGGIHHENVVELRAYYYSKDEKLMVYDYYSLGSVSSMLHGKRGEERIPLDWDTRLRIAIGAARGIARIHIENGGKLVHGNIKSSNIFLNSQNYGSISDLGLSTIMSPVAPAISRATGYRAPEVVDTRKPGQPSDVYSFGVVLLELLTGKSPVHTIGGSEVVHLVRWVQSVVREEWTAEVFDVELMRYPNIEEEMVEMLQIAMACVVRMPEQRPKMVDVVKMVEDIRRSDTGNRPSTEAKSSEVRSESSTPPPQQRQQTPAVGVESSSLQH